MHECKYEQINFNNGVTKYYCKGCKKEFFVNNNCKKRFKRFFVSNNYS